ncbi:MAG: response regulator [Methylovulum sp.]|nr:response regulator [Methylovulum sp.]
MNKISTVQPEKFLSTREAAARLGVALSTVQAWVETGTLPAWKTAGGHRRIAVDAVEAMRLRQQAVLGVGPAPELLKVLVVEDDPVQREIYRRQFAEWGLPVRLLTAEDGFEGLMLIGRHTPDLIITDLVMPEMDGFKMLRRLKMPPAAQTSIIVVTALTASEIEAQGGLPPGIPVYPKPIPFAVLRSLVEHLSRRLQV